MYIYFSKIQLVCDVAIFYCVTCHNLKPFKVNNHNGHWILILQKSFTKTSSYCHLLNLDEWMKNDVNVTL